MADENVVHMPKRGPGRPKGGKKKSMIGHNGPDEAAVRIAVNDLADLKDEADVIRAKVKKYRNKLKQDGFTMHILDRRIRMIELTPQEQKAEHLTDIHYGHALHQPVGDLLDAFDEREGGDDPEKDTRYWYNVGLQAGLAGKGWPEDVPDGCAAENHKSYSDGWEAGDAQVKADFLAYQTAHPMAKPEPEPIAAAEPDEPDEPTADEVDFDTVA